MIISGDKIITRDVRLCKYNQTTNKYDIQFYTGKLYSYAYHNIIWLQNPKILDPKLYHIFADGHALFQISAIYVFEGPDKNYWHICFEDGNERDYDEKDLKIIGSCFQDAASCDVFDYLKQIASLSELKNEEGQKLLSAQYEKVEFVGQNTALASYLNPGNGYKTYPSSTPIFPFGCNQSQYQAVKNAMEHSFSVIQGPPGTGKTQTILNIIANILLNGKTVQVVSNNNSATDNILEKLSSSQYQMGFIVAPLGKAENKRAFIDNQSGSYPDLLAWKLEDASGETQTALSEEIQKKSQNLGEIFEKREMLAQYKQELAQLELEMKYYELFSEETGVSVPAVKSKKELDTEQIMQLWQKCQDIADKEKKLGLLLKLRGLFGYGIANWSFYKQDPGMVIAALQRLYYRMRSQELLENVRQLETELSQSFDALVKEVCELSMKYLRSRLYERYGQQTERRKFSEANLWKRPYDVLEEYPVVLSTTFSSRSSLGKDVLYDYLIIDEASQVDVATGALALSCARNVVIVGDTRQLPNVLKEDMKKRAKEIFSSFHLKSGYDFSGHSFLQSVTEVIPDVPQTLLREHYRCHPKIIDFCNQKFYHGELLIMTKDSGEEDVLSVVRTAQGNHARNHYSQRQIDIIKEEVLPAMTVEPSQIGIIAPYNNQVSAIRQELSEGKAAMIDVATVHKFQGREKDAIILSTVDDEITDFADDPYLLNVAVSRAKNRLCVVVSGNEQPADKNITDLIEYIEYHNFDVKESAVYSIFDYLYKQYTKSRLTFLQAHRKVSQYDSENLMYALITEVLKDERYGMLDVVCHQPMNQLLRDRSLMSEEERVYVRNGAAHLDFLIYNRIGKKPVLAIEVDGYHYHKDNAVQAKRDAMKDHILEQYHIPLLRFSTNGSGEKEILQHKLEELLSAKA